MPLSLSLSVFPLSLSRLSPEGISWRRPNSDEHVPPSASATFDSSRRPQAHDFTPISRRPVVSPSRRQPSRQQGEASMLLPRMMHQRYKVSGGEEEESEFTRHEPVGLPLRHPG